MRNKYPFFIRYDLTYADRFSHKDHWVLLPYFSVPQHWRGGHGIYQLLAPIMALSYAFYQCGHPDSHFQIHSRLSRTGQKEIRSCNIIDRFSSLYSAFCYCHCLFYIKNAAMLAARFLLEPRCEPLIRIFCPVYSVCQHPQLHQRLLLRAEENTASLCQSACVEQLARVLSVYAIYTYGHTDPHPSHDRRCHAGCPHR